MSKSGRSGGSTMKLYSYDEFNRLVQYNDDGAEATYTYGTDNLRASKTVNGTTTSYVWNGQNLASETKNDTTTVYYYDVLGINGSKTDNDTLVRYIKDPHGNVVATNKDGEAYGTYDYTAFGNQLESTDTTNPFRYCGEYYDEESGMVYLRNRYYNSTTGRFISEDPIKDGVNWYVYCSGNPVAMIDPSGEYDRRKAVEYASYASVHHYVYGVVRFSKDCTNFVSWCLRAGHLNQSDDWYYNWSIGDGDYVIGSWSATWTNSEEQFKAFTNCTGEFPNTNYANGNAICIHESKWISAAIENYNIQPGDLLYFLNPKTNHMEHTAMIVSVEDGKITYAQHDDDKNDGDLGKYLDTNINNPDAYTYVYVVRIRDDA